MDLKCAIVCTKNHLEVCYVLRAFKDDIADSQCHAGA